MQVEIKRSDICMILPLLAVILLFCGCSPKVRPAIDLPRAQPAFLNWLEKQSMAARARDLIAQVSQTERVWLRGGAAGREDVLLRAAPNWLEVDPAVFSKPVFRDLTGVLPELAACGIGGIYFGDTGEMPEVWLQPDVGRQNVSRETFSASLDFDPVFGTEEDFELLAQKAESAGIQTGSSLLAAVTGLGPDFLLQARNAIGHAGLYAMLPVPKEQWGLLPAADKEWDLAPLGEDAAQALAESGLLPPQMARDRLAWAEKSGWAATGPILGTDGQPRRWVYRYAISPQYALLLWQDPSGRARRIFSAAIIRQTGLQGQSLTGLRMETLMGLEAGDGDGQNLEPGLDALNDLADEIHRYGGWAMQADELPAWAIADVLRGKCDFCLDAVTPALAVYAHLSADARPLASLYKGWLESGLEVKKLGRRLSDPSSVNITLFDGLADVQPVNAEAAARLLPKEPGMAVGGLSAGMPGLLFVGMQIIDPGWKNGHRQDAMSNVGKTVLAQRATLRLASGKIIAVETPARDVLALASALPEGGQWLTVCNFGEKKSNIEIAVPVKCQNARDIATGENLASALLANGRKIRLSLDVNQARHVFLN